MRRAGQRARTTSTAGPGHQGMADGGHSATGVAGRSLVPVARQLPQGDSHSLGSGRCHPLLGLGSIALLRGGFHGKTMEKARKKQRKSDAVALAGCSLLSSLPLWLQRLNFGSKL